MSARSNSAPAVAEPTEVKTALEPPDTAAVAQTTEATTKAPDTTPASEANAAELQERLAALERRIAELEEQIPDDRVSIVVFSGDLDRVLASLIIATGAAALGQEVSMFFTFWGLNTLRQKKVMEGKTFPERLMALMTPGSTEDMGVSKMNFFGIGARMLRGMMQQKQVNSPEELLQLARDLGVKMVACEMSRDVMGIRMDELDPTAEPGGVAAFLGDALKSKVTLFI